MNEEWKVVKDSDGSYYVSNKGRLRRGQKICTISYGKTNHYGIIHYHTAEGKRIVFSIHRLVALHFVDNPYPEIYTQVNHINGDKTCNESSNLEWCTPKMNGEHASKNNLINKDSIKRKEQIKLNRVNSIIKMQRKIIEYDSEGYLVTIYNSRAEKERQQGTKSFQAIYRLSHKGRYYRDYDTMLEKYGVIPSYIDTQHIKEVCNRKRKIYRSYVNGVESNYYELKELPISREELWFAFNHNIPDRNGRYWKIENI